MTSHNSGMKLPIPSRPAPTVPGNRMNAFNSIENSVSDPFSPFKIYSSQQDKKKPPPPRPPPPKTHSNQVGISQRRSAFGSSKKKQQKQAATAIVKPLPPASNIPVGTLIDLQSPPSSPQFPIKLTSSLSVGNITNYSNNTSLIESGFEDDFNSILSSAATTPPFDPWSTNSDFTSSSSKTPSPDFMFPQQSIKHDTKSKPIKHMVKNQISVSKPTIICVPASSGNKVKPTRPPPPSNSALCNVQNISDTRLLLNKEGSPPMPCMPPPPPPPEAFTALISCPPVPPRPTNKVESNEKQPYCIAEYDYDSTHPDDLNFKTGDIISLTSEVNDEWLQGRISNKEGIFPKSYVKVMAPLSDPVIMIVIAVFPFTAETWDDLDLKEGDKVKVLSRINEDWLYGECDGKRGQFPECYTQDITDLDVDRL